MRGVICFALVLGVTLAATSMPRLQAAEFGTRDEAVAMVRRVQEKFKKDGPEATFRVINNGAFNDRDLYPFVHTIDPARRKRRLARDSRQKPARYEGSGRQVHDPGLHEDRHHAALSWLERFPLEKSADRLD